MAISVVGTPQAAGTANGGNTTLTFDVTPSEGDVVFVCGVHYGRNLQSALPTTSGYTTINNSLTINDVHLAAAYKVMGSTPDTNVVVAGSTNGNDGGAACAIVLRGVHASVLGATAILASGNSTNPNPGSITTANDNSLVLVFSGSLANDSTPGTITGYSNIVSALGSDINYAGIALATKLVPTAGVENPAAWSTWITNPWKCFTIEVREAAGGTVTEADFDSDGVATVAGVGGATVNTEGDSDGVAVVAGVGQAIALTSFNPAGIAVVAGIAAATVLAAFVSTGQATVGAEGANAASSGTIHPVDGTSFGTATVIGVGAPVLAGVGIVAGVATVNGMSEALAKSDFDSDGVAVVNGVGGVLAVTKPFDGNSNGVATVNGVGIAVRATTYGANGIANVNGISGVLAKSVYGANGVATVNGVGGDANAVAAPGNGTRYIINMRRRRRDVSNV